MLNPWSLLTGRGRVMLVVGGAVAVLAALLGHRDVFFLGLALVILPIVAAIVVARTRLRLSATRDVEPAQVAIGQTVEGRLVLDRKGRVPAGVLRFEDYVPPALGRRPRFTVQNVSAAWHREVKYTMTGRARGRHTTGPLMVRTSDPFGVAQLDRSFNATSEVMVTPRIWPLTEMRNAGGGGASGESRPHRIGVSGQEDILVREYRDGDDVRRVHWRSTARRGELMVRREEQAWDPSATVILDTRLQAHAGRGVKSSFEWAVSAAASVALHFLEHGYAVNVIGADGRLSGSETDVETRVAAGTNLLYALTDVTTTETTDFRSVIATAAANTSGQLLIAVTGRLTSAEADQLLQCQRNRSQAMAMVLDTDTWVSRSERASVEEREEHETAVRLLRDKLWRVVEVAADTDVPQAWDRLGHMGGLL